MANLIVGLPGDSILIHDQILARLSLFRPDGTHERTEQLTGLPGFSPFMTPLGLAPDGALVVRGVHEPPPPRFGPGLVEATAYLADLDEGRMDALAYTWSATAKGTSGFRSPPTTVTPTTGSLGHRGEVRCGECSLQKGSGWDPSGCPTGSGPWPSAPIGCLA